MLMQHLCLCLEKMLLMNDLEYTYEEMENGFWLIIYDVTLVPYARQTQYSKFKSPAARKYNQSQKTWNNIFQSIVLKEKFNPIAKGIPISLSADYKMLREKHSNSPKKIDTSNLLKALEDSMQGTFFDNDKYIYHSEIYKGSFERNILEIKLMYGTGDEDFL